MSAERIDSLRAARDKSQIQLQRYNTFRTRHAGQMICAFEGDEDVPFYATMTGKVSTDIRYVPWVCKGKDNVLRLREILARNVAADSHLVRYFIDHDFDGLKGHPPGANLYVTPCYSIENLMVGRATLEELLCAEYKCHDEHAAQDIANIGQLFDQRWQEFIEGMREANRLLFSARIHGVVLGNVDNDIKKYLAIKLDGIAPLASADDVHSLIGYSSAPDAGHLAASEGAFDALDPLKDWRGKFVFAFFRRFLALLKEDRGTKAPVYFTCRANMSFNPDGDIIRALASTIMVPECLRLFLTGMAAGISHSSTA